MKHYKKKTIALILASTIAVAGAFGEENYRNSLMGLKFSRGYYNNVNMLLQTKRMYGGNIVPIRKDANTYVLMLPEVNSTASTPDLKDVSGEIQSVSIRTMPYTSSGKGYTRITVKTYDNVNILSGQEIYIDKPAEEPALIESTKALDEANMKRVRENAKKRTEAGIKKILDEQNSKLEAEQPKRVVTPPPAEEKEVEEAPKPAVQAAKTNAVSAKQAANEKNSSDSLLLILGAILIIILSVFFYINAKNKMRDIAGEQIDLDLDDDEEKKDKKGKDGKKGDKKKISQVRSAIRKLDSTYTKGAKLTNISEYTSSSKDDNTSKQPQEEEETVNIVDLDELFQEQMKSQDSEGEENSDLDDFLSSYDFEDEEENPEGYDTEYYEKTVNNGDITFDNNDVERVNKLLTSEIKDDTLRHIDEYAESGITEEPPTKQEVLESLVTAYTIEQNITFTGEDVDALYKLINVEIDSEFLADWRVDPERTKEAESEIKEDTGNAHKTSEMLILNVKDMLPDLSEALRKQGGRKIESEVKPITVYYSEGYEYTKLEVKDELPDLTIEINNEDAYKSKPSADIELAASGWEFKQLDTSGMLPDLRDVMAHPEKYEEKVPERPIVTDKDLERYISNVQFKPFYDGSEQFEVINKAEDFKTPSLSDVQKELSQFGNFNFEESELTKDVPKFKEKEQDDFESLYSNRYIDFDTMSQGFGGDKTPEVPEIPVISMPDESTQDLPSEEVTPELPEIPVMAVPEGIMPVSSADEIESTPEESSAKSALKDGKPAVLNTLKFNTNSGCRLIKDKNGYTVVGYAGDKTVNLKQYEDLSSEVIHGRLTETLDDGTLVYMIKIGAYKFVVNVKDDDIKYVMDLC